MTKALISSIDSNRLLRQCLVGLLFLFSISAFGGQLRERYVESNDQQYVMDLSTGLIWTRCYAGGKYQNGRCSTNALPLKRAELAGYLKNNLPPGWRIPTTKEVASLVVCKSREDGKVDLDDYFKRKLTFDERFGFFRTVGSNSFPYACSDDKLGEIDFWAFPKRSSSNNTELDGIWTFDTYPESGYDKYYSFELFYKKPYFRDQYVHCGPGGCFGAGRQVFLAVIHVSELQSKMDFIGLSSNNLQTLAAKIPPSTLVWKASGVSTSMAVKIELPWPIQPIASVLTSAVGISIEVDTNNIPAPPAVPILSNFIKVLPEATKGEFETTANFEARRSQEKLSAERKAETDYRSALDNYQLQLTQREQRLKIIEKEQESPEYYRQKLLQSWGKLGAVMLGDPVLTDIRYDADQQEFIAVLKSTIGNFEKEIRAPVAIKYAESMKANLISGKIAPKVEFQFPSMAVSWTLVENEAQRAKRFSDANSSISVLEALIIEFPDTVESKAARSRIFTLPKTSKELAETINRNQLWAEANEGRKRLAILQKSEFDKATRSNSSYAYQEFLDSFGGPDSQKYVARAIKAKGLAQINEAIEQRNAQAQWERDRPRREANAMCQMQKQTCIASCPVNRYSDGSVMGPEYSCKNRCEAVSCN